MSATQSLTYEVAASRCTYDPETGEFHSTIGKKRRLGWIERRIGRSYIKLDFGAYGIHYAHRVAHLLMTGEWPPAFIDHINHDGTANQWSNLRPCTHQQNIWNMKVPEDHPTGYLGVRRYFNRFLAEMKINGQRLRESFTTLAEAIACRLNWERIYRIWK
jgi:hypothetical protein